MLTFQQVTLDDILQRSLQAPSLEQSLEQVKENANRLWYDAALRIVYDLCGSREEFNTDHVHRELAKTMHTTQEPRALGAVMREAAKNGWCTASGMFVKSVRPECHSRPIPVWQSEIFASSFVDQL